MMRAYLLELASQVASARGDLEGKLGALEENLENVETHLFPDFRPQWCVSQMHRGITLGEMDRLDESIEAFEAALAPAPGSDVPAVAPKGPQVEAEIRASFAEVLRAAGFPDEARDEFAHAADLFEEALGADHPVTKKARALGDGVPGGWRSVTTFVPQSELSERKRAAHRAERLEAFEREAVEP